jgi:hypothetical protein
MDPKHSHVWKGPNYFYKNRKWIAASHADIIQQKNI